MDAATADAASAAVFPSGAAALAARAHAVQLSVSSMRPCTGLAGALLLLGPQDLRDPGVSDIASGSTECQT